MPGIEVHMPTVSFSGPGAKWRFVSFGIVLLLGTAVYLAATAEVFRAAPAVVSGNQRISAEEINAVLGTTNAQVFTLVPADLEHRLRLNFPELLGVQVVIDLPNVVHVQMQERTPIILWNQDGGYTWIDDLGVAFRPRGSAENLITVQAQSAPAATGAAPSGTLAPRPFITPEMVEAIKALAPSAPAGAAILYDARYGFGWADSRGWQAYFGEQARDMALRLRVYDSMLQMVSSKGLRPAFISVQYPESPYYRMTQ